MRSDCEHKEQDSIVGLLTLGVYNLYSRALGTCRGLETAQHLLLIEIKSRFISATFTHFSSLEQRMLLAMEIGG